MSELHPHQNSYLYEIAYAYSQLGEYTLAIDYGEKLRLRAPEDIPNIISLIESYCGIGNTDRAKEILLFSLKTLNDDGRLMKVKEMMFRGT